MTASTAVDRETEQIEGPDALDTDPGTLPRPARGTGRRRPVRRALIVTHRWLSLAMGLVLLLVTTSGAILLYEPELRRAMNPAAYASTDGEARIGFADAVATVDGEHPDFAPSDVIRENGVFRVTDGTVSHTVDPATGEYLGVVAESPAWLSFVHNLHLCFLACAEQVGYLPVLESTVPGTGWLGFEGAEVSWGGLLLGLTAVLLLYLVVTGLWLWMPRPSRWRGAVTVRWRKGRFARDTDLHKIVGMVALAPLAIWGVTGAAFEFGAVADGWYAVTPDDPLPAAEEPSAEPPAGPADGADDAGEEGDDPGDRIGQEAALAAALRAHPGSEPVSVTVLPADDPAAVYSVWLAEGVDPYAYGEFPGNVGVSVDPYTAETVTTFGRGEEPVAQRVWESWSYPVHAGIVVDGWWRLVWMGLALIPLVLAVTGVSTWLVRLRSARARARRRRASASATHP